MNREWSDLAMMAPCVSLYLWGVWVVFCRFRQLLWSVHEGEEEQSHIIRAPIGRVWGHCWPIAVFHQALPQLIVNASLQFHWNRENDRSASTCINTVIHLWKHHQSWKVHTGFGEKYAAIHMMSFLITFWALYTHSATQLHNSRFHLTDKSTIHCVVMLNLQSQWKTTKAQYFSFNYNHLLLSIIMYVYLFVLWWQDFHFKCDDLGWQNSVI